MILNLDCSRGETLTFSGIIRSSAGAVVDLTGATLTWRIAGRGSRGKLAELTLGGGITVASPTTGAWSITIPATTTEDLCDGWYRHVGEATLGAIVYTFVRGRLEVRQDISA